ncbi:MULTISPECIES: multidrug effflux MFS transporter [unclassified Rathayibacter]|uniref:multidrug effflux MFS transporter n=1 Tax=unclassified Rathayibacter TaxID=2609250 RepID=UPI000CE86C0A|nr:MULTISPECIES: multidrug effflux MFS transporter [unclassified Rathayibacter]PPG60986.1 Bcr/CflA family drug resistance efflux transporter [Rathayibacter sp. AY1C5]PPH85505.1 Bcr/CflA family drug resistance efflux transporter [Rathayibacter sp. AY1D5]
MTASTASPAVQAMPRGRLLLPIFAMLVGFGPLTIDLVLPFLPTLQDDLGVSVATAQLVVTGATFGFAAGQLISGPLSDAVGRKWPLGVSAALHIAASLVAAMTSDTAVLLSARFVQGAACTAAGVVVTAIVRDLYSGKRLVTMLANLAVIVSVFPILVPSVGAQLTKVIDWRGSFLAVAAWGALATVIALLVLPETLPRERRHQGGLGPSLRNSFGMLRRPRVLALAAASAAGWSVGFAYLATAPFLYTNVYAVGPDLYGLLFLVTSLVTIAVGQTTGRVIVPRFGPRFAMFASAIVTALGAVVVAVLALTGTQPLLVVVGALTFALAGRSLGFAPVQYLSLQGPSSEAGSVTAILGTVSFTAAGLVMPVMGAWAEISLIPFAILLLLAGLVEGGVALLFRPGSRRFDPGAQRLEDEPAGAARPAGPRAHDEKS